ncbi:MAG: hypothetical protein MK066_14460 [Crocinitomicaceae bacterium]|nr:hypothetical protein [Crocinitomicaceae bacterium]
MNRLSILLLMTIAISCQTIKRHQSNVVTQDIDNFWESYELAKKESDSLLQIQLIDSLYIQKGSIGLKKMMEVRNYTASEYVNLINNYPNFFESIRANTLKSKFLAEELNDGIEKLEVIYPDLKPAKIYFTIGCMRTNGTTRDSLVLIGSELAMAESNTDISEFEGETKEWLETFFSSNPINGLVLLNVHEYVHTQQPPIPGNLLHIVLYEGVAEFVSVVAMGVPSNAPAIEFGKNNSAVREIFEREMFYEWTPDWLWSNSPNEFGVRDLGYYIGYSIAERYYNKSSNKQQTIKELIELDYSDPGEIDAFIDNTGFFSKTIEELRIEDQKNRPNVVSINEIENGAQNVDPNIDEITIHFSEKLNGYNTGVNYSDLGKNTFPKVVNREWAADSTSWKLKVDLESNKHYKFWITSNFRTENGVALLPYLIEFKTKE